MSVFFQGLLEPSTSIGSWKKTMQGMAQRCSFDLYVIVVLDVFCVCACVRVFQEIWEEIAGKTPDNNKQIMNGSEGLPSCLGAWDVGVWGTEGARGAFSNK